ncbi:MAG: 2Fe-2S iron-sulfur cluster-binding protein [Pseudomonadota bacterium]
MVKVTFIEHDGTAHEVNGDDGLTVMEVAVKNGVPGIDADCGGACACATCHVYVDEGFVAQTGEPNSMEESMLDFASEREDNSRLACQVKLADNLNGMTIRIPEFQG